MKKFIILLITFLAVTIFSVNGQVKYENQKTYNVTIEGEIKDTLIKYGLEKVQILISQFPGSSFSTPYTEYEDTTFISKKPFKFNIPIITDREYMSIVLLTKKGIPEGISFDNIYILDKGDRIKCKLTGNFYQFSGRGSEKLNCQSEIYRYRYRPSDRELKLLNAKKYDEFFNQQGSRYDSLLTSQLSVVKRYGPKIGKNMADIMTANCYGLRYYMPLHVLLVANAIGDRERVKGYLNSLEYKKINLSLNKKIDHKLLAASPIYTDFLYEKICVESLLNDKGVVEKFRSESVVKRIYNTIMATYSDILREKLLATFFFNYKYTDTSQYWTEILNTVKNKDYRKVLLQQMNLKETGIPIFPFELKDSVDHKITLSDLKNKVAVFDFWYTGCENCVVLNRAMAPVYEKYKDNPNVLFVSVSIDKDKTMWLKSVAKGLYNHSGSLSLYTNGLGQNHPLIKHYDIVGYPTLFILKDEKMFFATPERPELDHNGEATISGATERFIELIDSALKTNYN